LAGFFLGYSTLLRIFPVLTFSGPVLMVLRQAWGTHTPDSPSWKFRLWRDNRFKDEERYHTLTIYKPQPWKSVKELIARVDRRYLRLFVGAALAIAILMPISLVTSGGVGGYRAFIFNTTKHKETPLTNHMGLRTVVTYNPAQAGRVLRNDRADDPWGVWKKTKVATFQARKPLYLFFVAGFVLLLFAATKTAEPWMALAMGSMMIAIGIELTCYYYSFLFAVAFLYKKRHEAGAILLAATAATGFIDWAPTKYLPDSGIWGRLKMSQWLDEQYMFMSVATLVAFVWIMYRFGYPPLTADGEPEAAASEEEANVPERSSKGRGNNAGRGRRRK
jgi:hypothetical protein